MNRVTRLFLIVAVSITTLGLLLFGIGVALGGFESARSIASDKNITIGKNGSLSLDLSKLSWMGSASHNMHFDSNHEIFKGDASGEFTKGDVSALKNFNVDIGGADFNLVENEDGIISYEVKSSRRSQCFIEAGTLTLVMEDGSVTLSLPKDFRFESVDMDLGASNTEIANLSSDSLDLDFGASNVTFNGLSAKDADLDFGAGDVEITNGNLINAKIEIGAGNFTYKGDVTGNLKLVCGVGNADLFLTSKEIDHSYDIESGMGNIDYGKQSYSGIGNDVKSGSELSSHYKVECGLGNITVLFEQ